MAEEDPTRVKWKDTPKEEERRTELRIQPDDFRQYSKEKYGDSDWLYMFHLSQRIQNGLPNNKDVRQRLLANLTPITDYIGGTIRISSRYPDFIHFLIEDSSRRSQPSGASTPTQDDIYQTITIVDIRIGGGDLAIMVDSPHHEALVEYIKEVVADVALAEPREAFVKGKTASRVAQSIGLNDPLAAKEIGKYLGGRRKSRKSKKTHKKTLKRHNGGRR
jgi:hypothetical protein